MILMYHKVDRVTPTIWWVTPDDLDRQLTELSGYEFVCLDDYVDPRRQVVITFDDGYENLYHHAHPVLVSHEAPYELFVNSSLIGKWNHFDRHEPLTRFLGIEHLNVMVDEGARLQWHGRSHRDFTTLTPNELSEELSLPDQLRAEFPLPHFSWLSYPYGLFNSGVTRLAKQKFAGAVTTMYNEPDGRWQKIRIAVDRFTSFRDLPPPVPAPLSDLDPITS